MADIDNDSASVSCPADVSCSAEKDNDASANGSCTADEVEVDRDNSANGSCQVLMILAQQIM